MLKCNKYICILSIAVTTLLYIKISVIVIFSMYIVHVCLGSGRNSYQGHVNDSGEFWRVLGCTRIRCHWKRNIVDTFTHHVCTIRHGWIIGTSFPYIRKSERRHSSPVQCTCISSHLSWLYFTLQALLPLKPFTRWETCLLCCMSRCTTGYGPCHWDPCQCSLRWAQAAKRPIYFGLLVVNKEVLGKLAIGLNIDLKSNISTALAVWGSDSSLYQ